MCNHIKKCPNCGSRIVYAYNYDRDSYYLRCEKNYQCWHMGSNEDEAKQYPQYRTKDDAMMEAMREAIEDDEVDFFHWE